MLQGAIDCFLGCGLCGDCQGTLNQGSNNRGGPHYDANYLHHPYDSSSKCRVAGLNITIVISFLANMAAEQSEPCFISHSLFNLSLFNFSHLGRNIARNEARGHGQAQYLQLSSVITLNPQQSEGIYELWKQSSVASMNELISILHHAMNSDIKKRAQFQSFTQSECR